MPGISTLGRQLIMTSRLLLPWPLLSLHGHLLPQEHLLLLHQHLLLLHGGLILSGLSPSGLSPRDAGHAGIYEIRPGVLSIIDNLAVLLIIDNLAVPLNGVSFDRHARGVFEKRLVVAA